MPPMAPPTIAAVGILLDDVEGTAVTVVVTRTVDPAALVDTEVDCRGDVVTVVDVVEVPASGEVPLDAVFDPLSKGDPPLAEDEPVVPLVPGDPMELVEEENPTLGEAPAEDEVGAEEEATVGAGPIC